VNERIGYVTTVLNQAEREPRVPLRLGAQRKGAEVAPLLAVAAPLGLLTIALATVSPALVAQDFWLAVVSGRDIAEHGLPSVDHLTVMGAGHHWVDQQWLAQLLLYGLARLGGTGVAAAVSLLSIVAAFGLAALTAQRRGASPPTILLFLIAGIAAAPWGAQLRPQALVLPLFSLILWLLARDRSAERSSTLLVLPVLCLWANLHGSAVLGVLLVAAWALQALIGGLGRTARNRALACLVLSPATLLASPYALSLPGYYRLMLLDPPFGRQVKEWHRTIPSAYTAVFFALAALAVVLALARRRRLGAFDRLALALTLATGLEAIRGIVWFGLACVALLPALATRRPGTARLEGRAGAGMVAVALATLAGALAWVAARPAGSYETRYPPGLLALVHDRAAAGDRVLASDATADWLLWKDPSLRGRVAYDVRFELYSRPQIQRLVAWTRLAPGWQAAIDGYSLVVTDRAHLARLVEAGGWRRVLLAANVAVAERAPT
jgi:hypothetical protein